MLGTFIDTGAFCAFSDRRDHYHFVAVKQFSLLIRERSPLITSNFIVDETYTWIRYRLGHPQALEFLQRTRDSENQKLLRVVAITRPLEEKATSILKKFQDHELSYTDATSMALILEQKIPQTFTFDKHFYLIQVSVIPGVTR